MLRISLCLLALASLGAPALAQQVPNGTLETWTTTGTLEHPQNWLTFDDLLYQGSGVPFVTGTTTKTTDAHSGSFAAQVQTVDDAALGLLPGYLILGTRASTGSEGLGGLPYTGRPTALQLHYKLTGPNVAADSAYAGIVLTRTVNGRSETVGQGVRWLTAAATTYTLATVPVQYFSSQAPDSIRLIVCSGLSRRRQAGTTVFVDDITLTTTTLATHNDAAGHSLALYPNPSADGLFTLEAAQEPALLAAGLTVLDPLGRVVLAQAAAPPAAPRRTLDLHGQPAGVYTLRLAASQGPVVRRLVIR